MPLLVAGLCLVFTLLVFSADSAPQALAVEPGVNCSSYEGDVCVIEVGDTWFCLPSYQDGVCPTSISAGDMVRWEYPSSGLLVHNVKDCGDDCDAPTSTPLWDSDLLRPGGSFQRTFTTPGEYLYYCWVHPLNQRGLIRVLPATPAATPTPTPTGGGPTPPPTPTPPGLAGDVNCDTAANSIDATLVLQFDAGLVDALDCQQNGDVNGDASVDSLDAALILQFDAGLIDSLPR